MVGICTALLFSDVKKKNLHPKHYGLDSRRTDNENSKALWVGEVYNTC